GPGGLEGVVDLARARVAPADHAEASPLEAVGDGADLPLVLVDRVDLRGPPLLVHPGVDLHARDLVQFRFLRHRLFDRRSRLLAHACLLLVRAQASPTPTSTPAATTA